MSTSGLFPTDEHVQTARKNRDTAPFSAAWEKFRLMTAADPAAAINLAALRWRLDGDAAAAEQAAAMLDGWQPDDGMPVVDSARRLFALCQALSCLDGHPALTTERRARAVDTIAGAMRALSARQVRVHEAAWVALVELSAGVVADQADLRDAGAAHFRDLVAMVVPHGYVPALVESKDALTLTYSVQFAHAMILCAEVGAQAGIDLWGYEYRGVSVMTAALYPLYYYYYPEKWPWTADSPFALNRKLSRKERAALSTVEVDLEPTQGIFQQHAAFLELINRRTAAAPVHAVTLILDELRPIADLLGGGPVTLTHALPPRRRGLFGR